MSRPLLVSMCILSSISNASAQEMQPKDLRSQLLKDPFVAVYNLTDKHYTYFKKMNTKQKNHPLAFITECLDRMCPLTRDYTYRFRKKFEKFCVQHAPKELKLVSFGSGFLFTELVLLTLFFEKYPKASISLDCIDPIYQAIKKTAPSKIKNPYQKDFLEFSTQDQLFIISALKKNVLNYFVQCYPNAQLKLNFHTNTHNFLQKAIEKKTYPNFIVAIDTIEPYYSGQHCQKKPLFQDYIKLCSQVKKNNPKAQNYHLEGKLISQKKKTASIASVDTDNNNLIVIKNLKALSDP